MTDNKNNIPKFLLTEIHEQYNKQECDKIIKAFYEQKNTTFRINTLKSNSEIVENELKEKGIEYQKSDCILNAYFIKQDFKNNLINSNCYKQGLIYIQNFSSMIPPLIAFYSKNMDILDMCAAPGSKTTLISALNNNQVNIMACEKDKIRLERLKFNIQKLGASKVIVHNVNALDLEDYYKFDLIFLDAPCSGSGTLNNYSNNYKYFTEKLVSNSCFLQKKLLNKAINLVKVGGEIIYSTCSILKQENEEIIKSILNSNKVVLENITNNFVQVEQLKSSLNNCLTILPTENFEGFFVAKLKRIK